MTSDAGAPRWSKQPDSTAMKASITPEINEDDNADDDSGSGQVE